jgi:lysophospholipase L1-like esterase
MQRLWTVMIGGSLCLAACNAAEDSGGANASSPSVGGTTGETAGTGSAGADSAGSGGEDAGVVVDTATALLQPDDPNLRYTGRIDFTHPKAPKFSAPAVYIQARFTGSALTVHLRDQPSGSYPNSDYYDVLVDDAPPVLIKPQEGIYKYPIAASLPDGEHRMSLVKRTQASIGIGEFRGLGLAGELLPIAESSTPPRRMEFIGDSITCGEGNDLKTPADCNTDTDGYHRITHNAYLAFGPVLARSLGADYHVTAVSGIGLVQNYDDTWDPRPMPEVYPLLYVERKGSTAPLWPVERFVPDAIVIALGTNDYGRGSPTRPSPMVALAPADFAQAYIAFIDQLKRCYDDATHTTQFFCMQSPLLGDTAQSNLNQALDLVIAHYADAGDPTVHLLAVAKVAAAGCSGHPDVSQHQALADTIQAEIQAVMAW